MIEHLQFQPDWVSPPGNTVRDIMRMKGLTPDDLALQLEMEKRAVQELLSGDLSITIAVARKLEHVTGASVQFWMTRERNYRESLERRTSMQKAWLKQFPLREMIRLGWVDQPASRQDEIATCLRFFGVRSIPEWRLNSASDRLSAAFRKSPSINTNEGSVRVWLRQSELQAERLDCRTWDRERFISIIPKVRELTLNKNPNHFLPKLQKLCADCGVAVVVVGTPSGCPVSGAAWFQNQSKAIISLTFRFRSDDQFWFSFFHEAGHLILHEDNAAFLEGEGIESQTPEMEHEANLFAARTLIPLEHEARLSSLSSNSRDIIRFSVQIGVSPGIVVGQLQHRGVLNYNQQTKLINRFGWE